LPGRSAARGRSGGGRWDRVSCSRLNPFPKDTQARIPDQGAGLSHFRDLTGIDIEEVYVVEVDSISAKLQFRAESFNFTNTPGFNNPNTELGNANFGHITAAGDCGNSTGYCFNPRAIQLGLKVMF